MLKGNYGIIVNHCHAISHSIFDFLATPLDLGASLFLATRGTGSPYFWCSAPVCKRCKVRDVMKEIRDAHHQQNRRNMKDTMQDLRDDQHLRTSSCLMNSTLGRCPPHPCKLYLLWVCCFWMMKMVRVKMTKKFHIFFKPSLNHLTMEPFQ